MSKSLPPELRTLSISDRLLLIEQIWESIAEDQDGFELSPAHKAELDRRLDLQAKNPNRGRSWEDIRNDLLGAE
jgi:putative addiction module component (TIGR02574 family)